MNIPIKNKVIYIAVCDCDIDNYGTEILDAFTNEEDAQNCIKDDIEAFKENTHTREDQWETPTKIVTGDYYSYWYVLKKELKGEEQ